MHAVDDVVTHHPESDIDRRLPNPPLPLSGATPEYQRTLSPAIDEAVGRLGETLGEVLYPRGTGKPH
jgi:hypothetical protein